MNSTELLPGWVAILCQTITGKQRIKLDVPQLLNMALSLIPLPLTSSLYPFLSFTQCLSLSFFLSSSLSMLLFMKLDCHSHCRSIAASDFKMIYRDVKAYKLAVRSAWAVSPLLAVSLRDRYPLSSSIDGRSKGISCLSSLAVESPEGLRGSWSAVQVLLDGLLAEGLKKRKMKMKIKTNSSHEVVDPHPCDVELGTQDLLLWESAPVAVVIRLLSRIAGHEHGQKTDIPPFYLQPGIIRYCSRSLSVADPRTLEFFLPQFVQLLRGEATTLPDSKQRSGKQLEERGVGEFGDSDMGGVVASLLLDMAESSMILCHKYVINENVLYCTVV